MTDWPRVVSEDIVKQVHRLKNEMFVMGGKIKGKTLLPIPEHLGSLDGTLDSMERWVAARGGVVPDPSWDREPRAKCRLTLSMIDSHEPLKCRLALRQNPPWRAQHRSRSWECNHPAVSTPGVGGTHLYLPLHLHACVITARLRW